LAQSIILIKISFNISRTLILVVPQTCAIEVALILIILSSLIAVKGERLYSFSSYLNLADSIKSNEGVNAYFPSEPLIEENFPMNGHQNTLPCFHCDLIYLVNPLQTL